MFCRRTKSTKRQTTARLAARVQVNDMEPFNRSEGDCLYLIIVHPVFTPDSNNESEVSVVEKRKSRSIANEDEPGLTTIK